MSHEIYATERWNSIEEIGSYGSSNGPAIRALYKALGDKAQAHFMGCSGDGGRERFTNAELVAARAAFVVEAEEGQHRDFVLEMLDASISHGAPVWIHFK